MARTIGEKCVYAHTYRDFRRVPALGYSSQPCPRWVASTKLNLCCYAAKLVHLLPQGYDVFASPQACVYGCKLQRMHEHR